MKTPCWLHPTCATFWFLVLCASVLGVVLGATQITNHAVRASVCLPLVGLAVVAIIGWFSGDECK